MFNNKFCYTSTQCIKCDYDKNGNILKTKRLNYIVSNLKFPELLFINFQTKTHDEFIKINEINMN